MRVPKTMKKFLAVKALTGGAFPPALLPLALALTLTLVLLLALSPAKAGVDPATATPAPPGPQDTCPVCGMFVAKYPQWIATVTYGDGEAHHFDGVKDLFRYLSDVPKWGQGRHAEDIQAIWVTEYYNLARIDARKAWYVVGSDVLGPMGHEAIPFATREDAQAFLEDHDGQRILGFDEIRKDPPQEFRAGGPHHPHGHGK
uniref:Nitrous oxide reductase accessory protein NosL n=1 Tax=Candidatus Kentrum eta TaxID=2126337 RepID=A0A450V2F5_9GAMM|nr:MAG: Nitrous oxide reductase accessory protein NosL [Candidatus Kentron sp. H]VFJ92392.1 MAG: Nitrous oxide reductase accessory protein NosL [Candidatus Kentron sp. H]VFJ98982.1 MAG: Nitrous oxide reductase accessory protein NosL [Candidatus Kentron sp. H]